MCNVDVFSPLLGKMPYNELYLRRPDGRYMVDGDNFTDLAQAGDDLGKYVCDDLFAVLSAASYYDDPIMRGEFLRQYGVGVGNWSLDDITRVLFDKPEMGKGTSIGTLPLTKYFGDSMNRGDHPVPGR